MKKMPYRLVLVFKWTMMILIGLFMILPILVALLNSFKTDGEIFRNIVAFPDQWSFDNYAQSFKRTNYFRSLWNTVQLVLMSISGLVIFSALAGYKLARTKTRLSKIIFSVFMLSMMIPFHSIMITLIKVARDLNVQGSLWGLSLIYIGLGSPMAVFLYHGFSKGIPIEIEEAALIDGCNQFQMFFKIVFPLLAPITSTIVILNTLWIWNDFLLPLLMLTNVNQHTILLTTQSFFGTYNSEWGKILATLILAMLPVFVLYLLLQRFIIKGISEGAIKS
ncbi:MAG: carbohydrate ABC transporter permease [Acholeplasmataceae bacterium]